ncbi:hypothetical protein [Rheinheimera sp. 4Y26]|uniref:hypothetical protein n=1 Tax=Rheinheimera sp. 4Y26 TaxID=2977811 RepID=UPI0021B0E462|nr:hypothetical protein [Rheinheimera sp. 4Y26]MCT6699263.1 hypothetical protein [Rheinheimera sp. 4Y26]
MRRNRMRYIGLFSGVLLTLTACGSDNSTTPAAAEITPPAATLPAQPLPDNSQQQHYQVLLFGNSHMRSHNFSQLLTQLIQAGKSTSQVTVVTAPGGSYLDERYYQAESRNLVENGKWTHLILQGQKYSTSGLYDYPTDLTAAWVELAKTKQTTPVLYPEHAQMGNFAEGTQIYNILKKVQQQHPSCLAPIPYAWEQLITRQPDIQLHERDGNHANLQGAMLSALVLYEVITNSPADQLPYIANIALTAATQQLLRQQASATLQQYPACPK